MLRVLIADDEIRVCRLIEALIDWKKLELVLAGIANNGEEACEMAEQLSPDILITDIRMPGCSGLELIQRVKQKNQELEIIIISGYAHFEYAQQAIKYGVGNYLLKPINKEELSATLEKLKNKITARIQMEQGKQELLEKSQKADCRLREKFVLDFMDGKNEGLSYKELIENYHIHMENGYFQGIYLKMDADISVVTGASARIFMEKAKELLEQSLEEHCAEYIFAIDGYSVVGILNYQKDKKEGIRKILKNCLNQMEVQKKLFAPADFSLAVGFPTENPDQINASMQEAKLMSKERLIKGTGRLLERMGEGSSLSVSELLNPYLRKITSAVELMDLTSADAAVDFLYSEVNKARGIKGYEIFDLVNSAAHIFAARIPMEQSSKCLEDFKDKCELQSSVTDLLECLREFQKDHITRILHQHENETARPVRIAKQYIQNHYSEQISLEDVSSEVGLSVPYFSALFKKTEGEGFAKYLINVRMEQAKIFLRESSLSVTEICRKVGYNDVKHFTHTFEKAAGVKPSTYRKLYG